MQIIIVNPNTTASMTATIEKAAMSVAALGTEIVALTSTMGPVSIEGYYDEALAIPGLLLEIAKGARRGAQAAVIACFDDTGLDAARAMTRIPVIGICEAALSITSFVAQRFTIVTTMERSRVPIEHLVHRYGMGARAKVRAADIPVLSLDDPHTGAIEKIEGQIQRALAEDRAEAIVLGCAGMADLATVLTKKYGVPVIDGVAAAVKQAEAVVNLGLSTSKIGSYALPISKAYSNELQAFAPQKIGI